MIEQHESQAAFPAKANKAVALKEYLADANVRASITAVLPKHMHADRLVRIALQAASRNPTLLECTRNSFVLALVSAAQLGLEAGGLLGSAYLVPYRNKGGAYEVQLITGYRGLIDLARRSGQIRKIEARLVFMGDEFRLDYGADQITHVPQVPVSVEAETGEHEHDANSILGAYAVATMMDGTRQFEFMSRREIDRIRQRSKAAESGPWVTDFAEMARKTAVRRLVKYLPLSPDLARVLEIEDNAERGGSLGDLMDDVTATEIEPEPATKTERLARKLGAGKQPKKADAPDPDAPDACLESSQTQMEIDGASR